MKNKVIKVIIIILSLILVAIIAASVLYYMQRNNAPPSVPTHGTHTPTPHPTQEIIEVRRITIQLESRVIHRGKRFFPEVTIYPDNATDKSFEIHSDNERVLRLLGHNWTAVELGTANLIATASNGVTGTIRVTVTPPDMEGVTFAEEELTMRPGDTIFLTPEIIPDGAFVGEAIVFSSSNERVATVAADGRVTALTTGNTVVTCTIGEFTAAVRITVSVAARSVTISMNRYAFSIGEEAEIIIEVDPPNATNIEFTVSFSGASVTPTGSTTFRCDEAGDVIVTIIFVNGTVREIPIVVYDLAELANAILTQTNIERARVGSPLLVRNTALNQAALTRARESIIWIDETHVRPDGRPFQSVLTDNNIEFTLAGENFASGQESPAEAVRAWMDSETHRRTMLRSDFGKVGIGVALDSAGVLYWLQLFTN